MPSAWTDPIPLQCVALVEYWQAASPAKPSLQAVAHVYPLVVPPQVPVRCCRSGKGQAALSQAVQVPFCVGLAPWRYSPTLQIGGGEHCLLSDVDLPSQATER